MSLDIDFGKDGKKIFFLDDAFTFLHLKDLVRNEYPNKDIDLDFSKANPKIYDETSNVTKFINDSNEGTINVSIGQQDYSLKNLGWYNINICKYKYNFLIKFNIFYN